MSGTIGGATYGVAKAVRLVAVRVLTCAGTGLNSGVIAGVDWVTGNHAAGQPAVANMSLGGERDRALEHLKIGVDRNPKLKEWAAKDSDLDAIRDDPSYPA